MYKFVSPVCITETTVLQNEKEMNSSVTLSTIDDLIFRVQEDEDTVIRSRLDQSGDNTDSMTDGLKSFLKMKNKPSFQ